MFASAIIRLCMIERKGFVKGARQKEVFTLQLHGIDGVKLSIAQVIINL